MAAEQFRFHIPSLPKEVWTKFQELRKAYNLKQREMITLGVVAVCKLGELDPAHVEKAIEEVKAKFEHN